MLSSHNNFTINQQGTALLLALIILSGVLAVGSVMIKVVIQDLQQSRNLDYSVVAYYAAESGAERALYAWRKQSDKSYFSSCSEQVDKVDWQCQANTQIVNELYFPSLPQLRVKEVPLYDPANLAISAGVDRMVVSWQDKNPSPANLEEPWLEVTLLGWPAGSSLDFVNSREIIKRVFSCSPVVAGGAECSDAVVDNFIATNSYIVRLKPLYDDISQIRVKFYDSGGSEVDLSPYLLTANFTGTYQNTSQALRLQIPLTDPAANMFDYVIFAEEDIDKIF